MMSPADIAKKHKKDSEERKEAANYRFPEGEDFVGKVITAEDTLSAKKKTPCYEITCKTKELNKKGKKVNIIVRFMKNEKSMGYFYAFLELAGADLSRLRFKQQDTLDEDIQTLLEILEDKNPVLEFNCTHQEDSTHNNYYINLCDQVLATKVKKDEPEPEDEGGEDENPEPENENDGEDNIENEDSSDENSDSAFDDDDED